MRTFFVRAILFVLVILLASCAHESAELKTPTGAVAKRPVVIHKVSPKFPPEASARRGHGVITVEGTVNQQGRLEDIRIAKNGGGDPALERAAIEAAAEWIFRPATLDDRPIKSLMTITVNFEEGNGESHPGDASEKRHE